MATRQRTRLTPDERRRHLLGVARELFATRPYPEVTMTTIAREAGVTRALVHHYFGTIRDLYLATIKELRGELLEIPGPIEGLSREERVRRNVDTWLDMTEANRETFLTIAAYGVAIPDGEVLELIETGREQAIDRMIAANSDLISDTPPARLALRGFLAAQQAICGQWLAGRVTREQVHSLLTRTFLDLVERTIPQLEAEAAA